MKLLIKAIKKEQQRIVTNRFLDFGFGFYTTTNFIQAKSFAGKVQSRRQVGKAIVSKYDFNEIAAMKELKILRFNFPNEEWLDFVSANRDGVEFKEKYDIVIGPVADDDVYQTFALYKSGILTKNQTIENLRSYTIKWFLLLKDHLNILDSSVVKQYD